MDNKTILFLHSVPPEAPYGGGVENLVRELIQGFRQQGYKTQVLHSENSVPYFFQNPSSRLTIFLYSLLEGFFIGQMARMCLTDNVKAVVSIGPTGWYPFQIHNKTSFIKRVHFYGGTSVGMAHALKPFLSYRSYLRLFWLEGMFKERLSGKDKLCVSNSEQTQNEIKQFFKQDSVTLWRPMNINLFCPQNRLNCRAKLGLKENDFIGVFVGHTGLMKNFAMVQKMIDRFPHIQWLLALRGTIPPDVCNYSQVRLFHRATHEQLALIYNSADFSLCPSHYEPFGYVVSEALACGTPVIAAPGGASRLFLQNPPLDSLLVHSSTDTEGFAQAITRVLADSVGYRQTVLREIRPHIEEIMTPDKWWTKFRDVVNL
jgi:glycosyltransferase involved in cell wall biosynthesis